MIYLYRMDWTFYTSDQQGAGTDGQVSLSIWRDNLPLVVADVEPGETERLDRGEPFMGIWTFQLGKGEFPPVIGGTPVPVNEPFREGIEGHLKVILTIANDDAWRIGVIESNVYTGDVVANPDENYRRVWQENPPIAFRFEGEDVLSRNPEEGGVTLTLDY